MSLKNASKEKMTKQSSQDAKTDLNGAEPKLNGSIKAENVVNDSKNSYDDDDISSSDSELDEGPPPMIEIERSVDIGTLKSAFLNKSDKRASIDKPDVVVKRENLSNLASNFEKGGVENATKVEREKPTVFVDKEQYSSFKEKFENIDKVMAEKEEARKSLRTTEIHGAGAEGLSKAKDLFEHINENQNGQANNPDRKIEIERSEADKKRIQKAFFEATDKEEPKECAVCGKMVYPVEKMQLEKKVFHRNCFKCCKCQKSLSVQNYTASEGQLYCKLHIMEKFNPDVALYHDLTDDTIENEPDEEEDYALVTKPKALDPNIVKSSLKSTDDLENIPNLKEKKKEWAACAEQTGKIEKRTEIDAAIFQHGKVKSRMSKFVESESVDRDETDGVVGEDDDEQRDPNVVRESRKKEEIKVEVGAKSLKNKWESGAIECAQGEIEDRSKELNELKRNVSVKERFKEKSSTSVDDDVGKRKSTLDDPSIDISSIHAVKEKFIKGDAFQENSTTDRRSSKDEIKFAELGSVKERFEKPSTDEHHSEWVPTNARCAELGDIKASFEQGGKKKYTVEELEARKRDNLQREFKRIQKEKRILLEKERREAEEAAKNPENLVKVVPYENPEDVRQCAELSSIKQRFEEGSVFKTESPVKKIDEDLEIKVASKARQKFMQIDQEGPKEANALQVAGSAKDSKWTKESAPKPEPINRRNFGDDQDENPEDYEVKNLLNKFKNIEQGKQNDEHKAPKPVRQITPPPADYRAELISEGKERDPNVIASAQELENKPAVKVEAKSIKAKFENLATEKSEEEIAEEKRKHLEEEFKKIKEVKETQKQMEVDEEPPNDEPLHEFNPDLAIAAEHTQKMKARWDKIQKKEAKKAQKSANMRRPAQAASRFRAPETEMCKICLNKVYLAERMECDGHFYHKKCFKCKTCNISLRLETCALGSDDFLYCQTHYKNLFNDLTHPLSHGPSRETTPVITNGFSHD